jgi:hypothetical protein
MKVVKYDDGGSGRVIIVIGSLAYVTDSGYELEIIQNL